MKISIDFFSVALQKNSNLDIFFDENIVNKSLKKIEVVYLCHGYGGDGKSWEKNTRLSQFVLGKHIIAVAISADNSFYLPNVMGFNYEEYILKDIRNIVEFVFPNMEKRENIVGLSMGGYGALRLALLYPKIFHNVGIFSTVADVEQLAESRRLPQINLNQLLSDNTRTNLFRIIENSVEFPYKIIQMCGLSDPYLEMNERLHEVLKSSDKNVSYTKNEGGHDWDFWNESLEKFLDYLEKEANSKDV